MEMEKTMVQFQKEDHAAIISLMKLLEGAGYYVNTIAVNPRGISLTCSHQVSDYVKDK